MFSLNISEKLNYASSCGETKSRFFFEIAAIKKRNHECISSPFLGNQKLNQVSNGVGRVKKDEKKSRVTLVHSLSFKILYFHTASNPICLLISFLKLGEPKKKKKTSETNVISTFEFYVGYYSGCPR